MFDPRTSKNKNMKKIIGLCLIYYRATNGAIIISSIDTSSGGVINKLAATFSFQTDTTNSVFFNISEGSINLK
jgi:hypothetical protein